MRLFTRTGASALDDPEYGHFDADPDGGFELPEPLGDRLHGFAFRGRRAWEDENERHLRLVGEELERRKDPATLLDAVNQLVRAAAAVAPAIASEAPVSEPDPEPVEPPVKAPVKRASKRAATAPQPE